MKTALLPLLLMPQLLHADTTTDPAAAHAYAANFGWLKARGDVANGAAIGEMVCADFIYSADAGWIVLDGTGVTVGSQALVPGFDSDRDGIPDAWERFYARNLTTMSALSDSDGDGAPDPDEYAADTHPFLASGAPRITGLVAPRQLVPMGPFLTDLTWTGKPTLSRQIPWHSGSGAAPVQ